MAASFHDVKLCSRNILSDKLGVIKRHVPVVSAVDDQRRTIDLLHGIGVDGGELSQIVEQPNLT